MSQHGRPGDVARTELDGASGRSFRNGDDGPRLLELLNERLRFETLLARLSATFIHLPAEDVDCQIERGLRQIVEFLDIDRSSLGQFTEDGSELWVTHSYTIPGFSPMPRVNLAAVWPWYTAMLRRGEVLRFARLPDQLPAEAVHEREYSLQSGIRSHLVVPFKVGESILGGIGFGSIRRQVVWSDAVVQGLQLVGEVFANSLARERAERVLRESEGRFRLMADTAPVMVWMSGPDKLCTYFNKSWLDFTGWPLHHEVGAGWSEGVHADDLLRCVDTYNRAFEARQEFRVEYRLRRFDGDYRWVLDTGVPRFESDGTFGGYIGSCIDIADQKRVEEALRESEARHRFLLESTHAIPWVADAESWRITYVGRQAVKLLGYPQKSWYEETFWTDHIHPDDREATIAFCLDHSRRVADYDFEYRMLAADGRTVWIHDIVHVVAEKGVPRTLQGFMIDVTARRRAEEESRGLRDQLIRVGRATMMGELAASIAHEVNQPLCAIVSNAQAIQRMLAGADVDVEEVREATRDITRDGQRASAVIARIRRSLQKGPVERSPVDVNDLIREVSALMRGEMAQRGVAIKLELADGVLPVSGDRIQLQQVILNLLANGADAMERVARDQRQFIIHSAEEPTVDGVTVTVKDSGPGIDAGDIDHVFDTFFTTKPSGIGIGLGICKSIVEAHGGKIWAGPNAGGGASFQFTLPGIRERTP